MARMSAVVTLKGRGTPSTGLSDKDLAALQRQLERRVKYREKLLRLMNEAQVLTMGEWVAQYLPREVSVIPRGTDPAQVWTWVDGPRWSGDADEIVPGNWEQFAVRRFITEVPHLGGRIKVRCA